MKLAPLLIKIYPQCWAARPHRSIPIVVLAICHLPDLVEQAPEGNPAWNFTATQIVYRLMAACR